jgi:hypothetical protein
LKNFYRSPFSKWPPQYCTNSTLSDFNAISYVKLKATFEIEQCWIFTVLWWPFWKWRPVEIFQCRESIQDVERGEWQNDHYIQVTFIWRVWIFDNILYICCE